MPDSPLPEPDAPRWKPLRSALLNLFRYDDQEFHYTNGRLLLRGNNGTGKSRVLALQLPFLLDGEIASRRVEPDADPAKRMSWNVLTDDHDNRTGYTWIEFGRRSPAGDPEYLTLGCGLHAVRGRDLRRWYFITPLRIGRDLLLRSEERIPHSRERLRDALGEHGTLYESVREYRQAVNDHLFQLPAERYEALLALLIQLRQPQLSRQLDEKRLSDALGNALPPLDPGLIAQVAESFRQVEADRHALQNDEYAVEAVRRFREQYARYAAAVGARRAADMRETHNRFETTRREAATAREQLRDAAQTLDASRQHLRQLRQALAAEHSAEQALRADPVMKTAERLERLASDAREADQRAENAENDLRDSQNELEEREKHHHRASQEAKEASARAQTLQEQGAQRAAPLGIANAFARLSLQDPDALQTETADLRQTLDRALRRLVDLEAQWARGREAERRAAEAAAQQRQRREQCLQTVAEETRRRQEIHDAHLEAARAWIHSLQHLRLPHPPDELLQHQDHWCDTLSGEEPLAAAAHRAHRDLRDATANQRANLQLHQQTRDQHLTRLREERLDLEKGADRTPPLPHTRTPDARAGRAGAPFWRYVDFRPDCPQDQRAGLEAALEASGLLDAWIDPNGAPPQTPDGDAWMRPDHLPALPTGSLADRLMPDPAAGDDAKPVQAILRRVALGQSPHPVWIDPKGHWQNGLLSGQWHKPEPHYIGAASRERARRARLREIDAEIEDLQRETARTHTALAELDARDAAAIQETEARPSPAALRECDMALRNEKARLEQEHEQLAAREEELQARQHSAREAERAYRETGQDLGMTAWLDRLEDLRRDIHDFGLLLERLLAAAGHALRARQHHARAAAERDRARERLGHHREARDRTAETSARLRRELDTLRDTAGQDVRQLQANLQRVHDTLSRLKTEINHAEKRERNADIKRAQQETTHQRLTRELNERTQIREKVKTDFARFCELGLLQEADADIGDTHDLADWSMTRVVDFVRTLGKKWGEDVTDEEQDRTGNAMTRGFQDLQTALSARNHRPISEQRHGAAIVTCEFQGARRSMRDLHQALSTEVVERKKILAAKEKEFIETYLVGEVADRLHRLIVGARELIRDMNAEIEHCAMSTGMRLRLKWTPAEDAPPGLKEAEASLARTQTLLTPEERDHLADFLQERIQREKDENEGGTWTEHLENAVDYRRWHRFSIEREQNGKWSKLTRRTHGTGSGGEKAMMLTLPQFAAAAAHYHAIPHAPRFILLDEAFVGIDADMRGKCMGLVHHFDLDVVMTSEREWGCYESIDGLTICQLATHPRSKVIAVSHWRWNGRARDPFEPQAPPPPHTAPPAENELFAPPESTQP